MDSTCAGGRASRRQVTGLGHNAARKLLRDWKKGRFKEAA
jgi:hypothetical protein